LNHAEAGVNAMKITAVEICWTRIPFDMGGKPATMVASTGRP
jgi:hypothetical protein